MTSELGHEQNTNLTADLEVKEWLDGFPEYAVVRPDGEFFFSISFDVGEVGQDAGSMFQVMVMSPEMSRRKEYRHLKRIVRPEPGVPRLKAEIEKTVREAGKKDGLRPGACAYKAVLLGV